jgi:hypothetical protein
MVIKDTCLNLCRSVIIMILNQVVQQLKHGKLPNLEDNNYFDLFKNMNFENYNKLKNSLDHKKTRVS